MEREIEEKMEEIRKSTLQIEKNTGSNSKAFLRGVLNGAGSVVGGILIILVIGWVLYLAGFIPGIREIAGYLKPVVQQKH